MPIALVSRVLGHYARRAGVASLCAAIAGCAARPPAAGAPFPRFSFERTLTVENSTTEPVTIYLADRGAEWFVGRVRPGETAILKLPWTVARPAGREFSLLAVPAGVRRSVLTASGTVPGPIRMQPVPGDYLTSVRWRLTGGWLVALPRSAAP